jgi:small subunit ribosomal protein S18
MVFIKKPAGRVKSQKPSAGAHGRPAGKFRRSGPMRRKVCRFCADKVEIDYKNLSMLRMFVTENGKIFSGRITGTCTKHQRELDTAIKRARMIAFLPFTTN